MKRLIIPVIAGSLIAVYIYRHGVRDLFTLGAVKKVCPESVDELEKRISEDEATFGKDLEQADRLAVDYNKLGEQYLKRKSWTPAITALEKAVGYGKSGAGTLYRLGVAYANRGMALKNRKDLERAEYHYRRSLRENGNFTDASYGLALLDFYGLKKKEEAVKIMKEIIFKRPSYYDAHFALARFYYEDGNFARSLNVYENLNSLLEKQRGSRRLDALKKKCRENISQVMVQLNRK